MDESQVASATEFTADLHDATAIQDLGLEIVEDTSPITLDRPRRHLRAPQ